MGKEDFKPSIGCLKLMKLRDRTKIEAKRGRDKIKWNEWRTLDNKINNKIRMRGKNMNTTNFKLQIRTQQGNNSGIW